MSSRLLPNTIGVISVTTILASHCGLKLHALLIWINVGKCKAATTCRWRGSAGLALLRQLSPNGNATTGAASLSLGQLPMDSPIVSRGRCQPDIRLDLNQCNALRKRKYFNRF